MQAKLEKALPLENTGPTIGENGRRMPVQVTMPTGTKPVCPCLSRGKDSMFAPVPRFAGGNVVETAVSCEAPEWWIGCRLGAI